MPPPGHWCPSQPRRTDAGPGLDVKAAQSECRAALTQGARIVEAVARSQNDQATPPPSRPSDAAAAGRAAEFGRTDLPRRLLDTPGPGRAGPGPSEEQANTRNASCQPAGRCRLRGRDSSTPVDPAGASESRTALEPNAAAERASTSCRPARKARRRAATPAPHGWNRRARSARWRRQGARFEPTFSRQSVVRSRGLVIAAAI